MLIDVGGREFKNGASHFIDRVEAGEVLTVTRHGRPVARMLPAGMPLGLSALIGEGKVRWNGRKPVLPAPIERKPSSPTPAGRDLARPALGAA